MKKILLCFNFLIISKTEFLKSGQFSLNVAPKIKIFLLVNFLEIDNVFMIFLKTYSDILLFNFLPARTILVLKPNSFDLKDK